MGPLAESLRRHWPEYLIEAALLGLFMVSAGLFGALLGADRSPIPLRVHDAWALRGLMGLAMGLTAVGLIYSPWGQRSGAHMNPAVTLTFLHLGKIDPPDALFYVLAQFAGGLLGLSAALAALGPLLAAPPVRCVATLPGPAGKAVAFASEAVISFIMMTVILQVSNRREIARLTGLCAGGLVALYILVEAPLSGMSLNPARTFGSALPAGAFEGLWIYFLAPMLGMLAAAELYRRLPGARRVLCAKLHHAGPAPCIFRCGYREAPPRERPA